jgi:mannose-6-phosphate isomerase-like protein (cupin superfamily)
MIHNKNKGRHFVSKGWGFEDWIVNKEEYCGKLLFIKKGKRSSWHYHKKKDETFYIQSGRLEVILGWDDRRTPDFTERIILERGDSFHVPILMRHQLIGLTDVEMFEFSTEHFDEDSIRVIKGD